MATRRGALATHPSHTAPSTDDGASLAEFVADADGDLLRVLAALSDPTRMTIVITLLGDDERACGTFPVEVSASTLSYHFRILREAGLITQRDSGRQRFTSLSRAEIDDRFPGLLDAVVSNMRSTARAARTHA